MKFRDTRRLAHRRRAFTLIEVLIVIAIVLALSSLVGLAVIARARESKRDLCRINMNTIHHGMRLFFLDFDRYPTDEEGLRVLWDKTALAAEEDQSKWRRYLESPMPADPWGSPWGYRQVSAQGDQTMYDLWSYGPDRQDGTEDDIRAGGAAATEETPGELPLPPAPR